MPWRAGEGVCREGKAGKHSRSSSGIPVVNFLAKGPALGDPRKTAKALWSRQAEHSRQLHQEAELRGRFWKKTLVLLMNWLCDIG